MTAPAQPFTVDQDVRPTSELLAMYPMWAEAHDRPCKIASIKPSFNHKSVFQGWDISIIFTGESARYLVSQAHLQPS